VGALEMMRQINRQRNCGHGVLRGMRFISDLDRESEIRHSNAVNCHFPMIGLILRIHESGERLGVHRSTISKWQLPIRPRSAKKIVL
jgi:hypothetical protein